ncbi:MAG: type II toxin-antitoxin system RelE/ParE family toxin [Chloroflexi bacterium]|nr:type II toxin-antitoxin system RelE/ParE family toxin [Chloroflexota bacterium]
MRYGVILAQNSRKILRSLADDDYRAVVSRLRSLAEQPRPSDVRKLSGIDLWRIRVRDFRVVYSVDDRERVVYIERIARRSEDTYKGL